jgi:hypothetical protein
MLVPRDAVITAAVVLLLLALSAPLMGMEHDRESVRSGKDVSEQNSALGRKPRIRKVGNHSKIAITSQPNLMAGGKGEGEPAVPPVFGSQPPIDLDQSSQKRTPVPSLALNRAAKDKTGGVSSQAVLPGFTHTVSQSGAGPSGLPSGLPSDRYVQAEAGGRTVRFFNTAQSPRTSKSVASVANLGGGGPAIPNTGIKALPSFDPKGLGASFSAEPMRGTSSVPAAAVVGQSVLGSVGSLGRSVVGSVGSQIPLETTEDMPFPFLPQEPTAMFSSLGEPLDKYCRTGITKRRDMRQRISRATRKSKAALTAAGESGEAPPPRPSAKASAGRGAADAQAMIRKARSVPTGVTTARDEGDDEAAAAQEAERRKGGLRRLPHHFPTFTSRGKQQRGGEGLEVLDLGDEATEKPPRAKEAPKAGAPKDAKDPKGVPPQDDPKAAAPAKGVPTGKIDEAGDGGPVKKEPSAVSFGSADEDEVIVVEGAGDPDDVGVGDSAAEVYPSQDPTEEDGQYDDDDDESFEDASDGDDGDGEHTPIPQRRVHILDEDEIPPEYEKDESFRPDHFCVRLQALEIWFENEMAVQLSMSSAAMLVLLIRMIKKFGGF